MGMRRGRQRQLGDHRSACVGAEPWSARELIAELVSAHQETIALVRTLLLTYERADNRQADAHQAAALTVSHPGEHRANARAIEAAALADAARLGKRYATDEWASHVMHLHGLVAVAHELYGAPVPAPPHNGPTAAAATALARFRSRDDCLGRPG
jgi:hypothetical protein